MADKFPSLPNDKQRVFSIDLARFVVPGEERAVVVTSERERLVLYWSKVDGSWASLEIRHRPLNLTPRAAKDSGRFRWTPRVGMAVAGDRLLLVYKRRFENVSGDNLWLDLLNFDLASDRFARLGRVAFPRGSFGIDRFGWCLWVDSHNEQLLIVAQAFPDDESDPRLVLLRTSLPLDAVALGAGESWSVSELDSGGWDFAVRREGEALAAIHRRVADSYSVDINIPSDIAFGPITIPLSEKPDRVSRTLTEMVTQDLALVQLNLATSAISRDSLPFGENPHIHQITPFIATVDRLASGHIDVSVGQVRFRNLRPERFLLGKTSAGWRAARLLDQQTNWPRYLENFARIQQAFDLHRVGNQFRISWSALWSLRPIVLFKYEDKVDEKSTLLTFGHQDSDLGALRATTFRVSEDETGDLKVQPETFTLLDIGHRHIATPEQPDEEPREHQQLQPHRIKSSATHAQDFNFVRHEKSANTMNGLLVAPVDRPESFYAYTEMGDGGLRVVFDGKLELPPSIIKADEKTFVIDWVGEPAMPGRAWVRLATPGFVATSLPGYFISPLNLTKPSLANELQPVLDVLAFVADLRRGPGPVSGVDPLTFPLPFGGDGRVHYLETPAGGISDAQKIDFISLTKEAADVLQEEIDVLQEEIVESQLAEPPRPTISDDSQPFRVEIHERTDVRFADNTLVFEGLVANEPNQAVFQFDWSVSDGTTFTGRIFEANLSATLPDFSRVNHGETQDDITVTLDVTAPDGQVSTVETSFPLPRSLWATLWIYYSAFRQPPDDAIDENGDFAISDSEWESFLQPGMFVRDVTIRFFRYSIRFTVDEDGRGTRVEISNRPVHDGRFRFLENVSGQGDTLLEVPISINMDEVRLTGAFGGGIGNLIQMNSVAVDFLLQQRFTTGVQTSEQRDSFSTSETVWNYLLGEEVPAIPSALCCLPVGGSSLVHSVPFVDFSLSGSGWALGVLVPAVIAAVGAAAILVILLPLLIVVAPAVLIGAIIGGGISAIVAFLVGAGLGALATLIIQETLLRPYIRNKIDEALSGSTVAASLQSTALLTYAGEGLAEAIALKLIEEAGGNPVPNGRERFRSPFFETIVIGEDECKAQLRV